MKKKQPAILKKKGNILHAAEVIKTSIHNATKYGVVIPELKPDNLGLASLPEVIEHMKHIRHLDLHGNKLARLSIRGMDNLMVLDLSHNEFIAFSMADMKNIEILNLSHNHLTGFSVSDASNLKLLYLKHNYLTVFNGSNLPGLEALHLQHNKLVTLEEDCISNMNTDNFLSLHLEDNPLPEDTIRHIQFDAMSCKANIMINYPSGAILLTEEEIVTVVIRKKAMPYPSFKALLEEKGIHPLPEDDIRLWCPVFQSVPEQVIFLKQRSNIFRIFDAEWLLECFKVQLRQLPWGYALGNPLTKDLLKLQHIVSPMECPLEKLYKSE